MEWIQRNPKTASGLAALAVLCVVIIVWGASSRSGSPAAEPATLGTLATPTATPTRTLTALPTPVSSPPASAGSTMSLLETKMKASVGNVANGYSHSLEPHEVVIEAGADGGLAALAWRIPHAKGTTEGSQTKPGTSWRLVKTEFGLPAYTGFYTYVGETRGQVWCTLKVDGKVVDHQEARGPWGQVYCGI